MTAFVYLRPEKRLRGAATDTVWLKLCHALDQLPSHEARVELIAARRE